MKYLSYVLLVAIVLSITICNVKAVSVDKAAKKTVSKTFLGAKSEAAKVDTTTKTSQCIDATSPLADLKIDRPDLKRTRGNPRFDRC